MADIQKIDDNTLNKIVEQVKESIEKQPEKNKKIIQSSGMLITTIETLIIWFSSYILPVFLLFIDNLKSVTNPETGEIIKVTIGLSYCQFYEANYSGILFIYTALTAVFLGKTLSKKVEHKTEELKKRKNFGKILTGFVGLTIFLFWSIAAPLLSNKLPYLKTYLNNINWETFWFIIIVGGVYVFNKLIIVKGFTKESLEELKDIIKNDTK